MYISHKSNVLQTVHETEWQCRRLVKGLSKSEYWTWLDSVTSGDPPVVDLSGETGYVIVECTDEDVSARLSQLGDYTSMDGVYNIKYYAVKRDSEIEGVKSHFIGQDNTRDARILAEKWVNIRRQRDSLIAETDWRVIVASESDEGSDLSQTWKNYRTALRDVPSQADPDNITWPTKPS